MSDVGEITHAAILAAADRCAVAADYGVAYRVERLPGHLPAITFATRGTPGRRSDDRARGEVRGTGYTVEDAERAFMHSLAEWQARPADEEDRRRGALIDAALAALDAGESIGVLKELATDDKSPTPPREG